MVNRKYSNDRIKALSPKILEVHHVTIKKIGYEVQVTTKEELSDEEIKKISEETNKILKERIPMPPNILYFFGYEDN